MPDTTPRDRPSPPRVQPHLLALPGYDPVTPVDQLAAQAGVDPADVLKLDANENPFGTHPAVRRALADFDAWSVYPDPLQLDLRAAIAEYIGVTPDRVVAGAGSDELIELSVRALVGPGQRILSCPPTFGMYRFLADVAALPLDEVERRDDFTLDLDAVLAAITPDTALVILASPNNPSGTALRDDELSSLLDSGATVAVDEAYGEYAGVSALDRFGDHPRLIVFRTFSKWAGLAGLRAGYGVFPPTSPPPCCASSSPTTSTWPPTSPCAPLWRPRTNCWRRRNSSCRRASGWPVTSRTWAGSPPTPPPPTSSSARLTAPFALREETPPPFAPSGVEGERTGCPKAPRYRRPSRSAASSCASSAPHASPTASASPAPAPTSTKTSCRASAPPAPNSAAASAPTRACHHALPRSEWSGSGTIQDA